MRLISELPTIKPFYIRKEMGIWWLTTTAPYESMSFGSFDLAKAAFIELARTTNLR